MGEAARQAPEAPDAGVKKAQAIMGLDDDSSFEAGGPKSVEKTNKRLTSAELKKKSFGFPKVTRMNAEDRGDLKFAKDNMKKEHYAQYSIKDGSGDTYALVIYDATNKSFTLFKSKLDSGQVEEKWDKVKKGKEDYPLVTLPGYDALLQSPEGTVKKVKKGDKNYVMARLRGGAYSQNGVRMSEA